MSKNNKITNNQPTISAKNIDDLVEQMIKEPVYHSRDRHHMLYLNFLENMFNLLTQMFIQKMVGI